MNIRQIRNRNKTATIFEIRFYNRFENNLTTRKQSQAFRGKSFIDTIAIPDEFKCISYDAYITYRRSRLIIKYGINFIRK
jgi:hypothetical protein